MATVGVEDGAPGGDGGLDEAVEMLQAIYPDRLQVASQSRCEMVLVFAVDVGADEQLGLRLTASAAGGGAVDMGLAVGGGLQWTRAQEQAALACCRRVAAEQLVDDGGGVDEAVPSSAAGVAERLFAVLEALNSTDTAAAVRAAVDAAGSQHQHQQQHQQTCAAEEDEAAQAAQASQRQVLLQLDHMRDRRRYEGWLQSAAIGEGVAALLLTQTTAAAAAGGGGGGGDRTILLVVCGASAGVGRFLRRLRSEHVDVDSRRRPCKERMSRVLADVCGEELLGEQQARLPSGLVKAASPDKQALLAHLPDGTLPVLRAAAEAAIGG